MILVFTVGLCAVALLRSVPSLVRALVEAREGQRLLAHAAWIWERDRFQGAAAIGTDLAQAHVVLSRAAERLDSEAFVTLIPGVRGTLHTAQQTAAGSALLARGGYELAMVVGSAHDALGQYRDRSYRSLTSAERAELLGVMGTLAGGMRRASDALRDGEALLTHSRCPWIAAQLFSTCDSFAAGGLSGDLGVMLNTVHALARAGDRIAEAAVRPASTDVLLLFLNNTELRPGGGFVGTYGLLRIAGGRIVQFTTDDVYNLDRNVKGLSLLDPPAPFRDHGIVDAWYLRDANWSPDFAGSAQTILDFYAREGGEGDPVLVVGFTPTFAAAILDIVGPQTIAGVRFDATNIADELEYQVERAYSVKGIPQPRRKDIIAPLSRATLDAFPDLPFRTWVDAMHRIHVAAQERQLMAYSTDTDVQFAFSSLDVAGRMHPRVSGEDVLMVVDANLGSLKTDSVMERAVQYTIQPDGTGGYVGRVQLTYHNAGTFTWKTTRYQTYTRVYFPPGTVFLAASGAVSSGHFMRGSSERYEELGRTAYGSFWTIEPGATQTLQYNVRLAPDVVAAIRNGSYRLSVQKQLGLPVPTQLTVDHDFGTLIATADPPEVPAASGDAHYEAVTDLRVDRTFHVNLQSQ